MITCSGIDCPLKNSCHRFTCYNQLNTKPLINVPYNADKKDCDEFWLLNASREEYIEFLKIFNMKYLIILLLFFTSCKKEQYTADNCPANRAKYFYYNNSTTETCCSKYISPCDDKTIQEFKNDCPSGWSVKYTP